MIKKIFLCVMLIILSREIAGAGNARFEFQKNIGEGEFELYALSVDTTKLKGELCFADTGIFRPSEKIMTLLSNGAKWWDIMEMDKINHACFVAQLYEPFNWFYSPVVKYGESDYRFIFIGEVSDKLVRGVLYQFCDFKPRSAGQTYRTVGQIDISVGATEKKIH